MHPNFQQLHDIAAVLLQDTELFPQDLAELMSCDAVVDMASQLMQDLYSQLFRRTSVGNFCRRYPGDLPISQEGDSAVQFNAVE